MSGIATWSDVLAIEAPGMPRDLPPSTYEMLRRGAAIDPSAPALSFFLHADRYETTEQWSYRELLRDVTRTANMFTTLGVHGDSVVAYVLPNLPETHFVIWGAEAAGIAFAVNPLLDAKAIANLLNAANAKVLVTMAPFTGFDLWSKMEDVLEAAHSLEHIVLVDIAHYVATPKGAVPRVPRRIAVHDFADAIGREPSHSLKSRRQFRATDLSSYFCTGGTTGAPKIAMRRHANEVANAWSAALFLGDSIGPGKTLFCGLPLFHVNGVLVTGLLPFSRGAHVVLGTPQGYRGENVIKRFWDIVQFHRINFFSGVPTLYASLLDVPVNGRDLSSLEYALCGAAPMPVEVFRTFQERTGIRILEGYGLTEATCVSSVNPPLGERRIGSIGLRVPGQAMDVVQLDASGRYERDCAVDEPGVIVISGPNVFAGYLNPEQNKDLWVDLGDGNRWLNTGDLGRRDAEGYFWLTGRKKDLIIRGGHNIDPSVIEEALHRHPAVELAAAVGRPDAHAGELPVAYVTCMPALETTEEELLEFARREIPEHAAIPKHIRILESMPMTAVGKIFKPELKRRETLDALSCALRDGGIDNAAVTTCEDQSAGTMFNIELSDAALESLARAIAGRFSFAFAIQIRSEGAEEVVGA